MFVRFEEAFASVMNAFAVLIVVTPVLCLFTYIAAEVGHAVPLRDDMLSQFDEAIGFHWPSMLQWADAHPMLTYCGYLSYSSLAAQAALMVVALTIFEQTERLQKAIYAFAIGAFYCGVVSAVVPALCAYTHYGITPSLSPHIDLVSRDGHLADLLTLRSGTMAPFSMEAAKGIITFPSFHATLGVVFTWAFWRTPWMRLPVLALNAALVLATPLHGSHYIADVLAGFVVAGLAITTAVTVHRKVGSLASRAATPAPVEASKFC